MRVSLSADHDGRQFCVSPYLMGHNLEMYQQAVEGLMSDRLRNPKFLGPAHPTSGVASGWEGKGSLILGMGFSSDTAQKIDSSIQQRNIPIHAGETLEVELWAKVRHAPVKARVGLRSSMRRRPDYVAETIEVNTAYYARYSCCLSILEDEANSIFFVTVDGDSGGHLIVDQVHLRTAGAPDIDPRVIEALGTLGITALRFPGGCVTTVYQWRRGLGPRHRRPVVADPQFDGHISYDFGIDDYLELCLRQNITPQVVVGIGVETPDDAAELAGHCRDFYVNCGVKPPLLFFQIGNEQFAAHETAHMTGEMYAAALRAYIPGIKAAYPDSRIIAVGYPYSGPVPLRPKTAWRELVLDKAADLVDIISNHYYKGQWRDDAAEQRLNAVESIQKIREDLSSMIADIKKRGLNTKVAVTEWNYWLYADGSSSYYSEPMDADHCLFVAGMLHMFCDLGEHVEISNYYHLLNGLSVFNNTPAGLKETAMAEVFRFYRPAFPSKYIPVKSDTTETGRLSFIWLRGATEDFLYVVNYSLDNVLTVVLPEEFAGVSGEALVFGIGAKGIEPPAARTRLSCESPELPPNSIARFIKTKIVTVQGGRV